MRIFVIKRFHRWALTHEVTNELLQDAVREIEQGLVEANLGSNLYKKRLQLRAEVKVAAFVRYSPPRLATEHFSYTRSRKVTETI